jgi:hypothetical protein
VPDTGFSGTDSFTYYLSSGGLNSNVATVTITVQQVPLNPIVVDSSYTLNENSEITVNAPGVLANDSDPNGNPLSAILQDAPARGTVSLNTNGSFEYTPYPNYYGSDSFAYLANDGSLSSTSVATVQLTIAYVPQTPTAENVGYAMQEDDRLTIAAPGVLSTAFDPQGLSLQAVVVNSPTDGNLTLNADGAFVYTPNPGFAGTDGFTFRAENGVLNSSLATVTINVSAIPATTVRLDPASDTGPSNSDRITRDTTPVFLGSTIPNLQVDLYEQPAGGSGDLTLVGQTVADAAGNFVVGSQALGYGRYHFWVQTVRANGLATGLINAGPLTIATTPPHVENVVMDPKTGQIQVTFQDGLAGMDLASVTDASNYVLTRRSTFTPWARVITLVTLVPPASSNGQVTVVLRSASGKQIPPGKFLFSVLSGGIIDMAGNSLDGAFDGTFPSGNGVPGSAFNAIFHNNGYKPNAPLPTNQYIPVLTNHSAILHAHKPGGPLVHTGRHPGRKK